MDAEGVEVDGDGDVVFEGQAAEATGPGDGESGARTELEPEVVDGCEYYDLEDGFEESRLQFVCRPVAKPTEEEIRQHKACGHSPFRPWCATCCRGAANDRVHALRGPPAEGSAPEVHSEYAFFRNRRHDKPSVPVRIGPQELWAATWFPRRASGVAGLSSSTFETSESGVHEEKQFFGATASGRSWIW